MTNTFFHCGDIGDCIASLPTVRALGGGHYAIGYREKHCRESMFGKRCDAIRPLLEEQSYIKGVRWMNEPVGVTHDFSTFRHDHQPNENLAQWQARHFGVNISESPWLTATPNEKYRGAVIVARSSRYHERSFPWPRLLLENTGAIFVGLPEEHAAFQHRYGQIEYVATQDMLELAEIMAASRLVIVNQTASFWLAIGLGCNVIQETWRHSPDSIIRRPNARYFYQHEPRRISNSRIAA